MTAFRDFFRRRRVAKHVRAHGWQFDYQGLSLKLPEGTNATVASALLRGKYEAEEIRMIQTFVPKDRPVIELGGSLGVVSAIIGNHLDADTPHLVVEANPHLQDICHANATSPAKSQALELVECAVSYGSETVVFEVAENPHASGLSLAGNAGHGTPVEVKAVTLAALHDRLGAPEGYSLICDIEGGEADMMAHDPAVVAKAGTVVMELHPTVTPDAAKAIPDQMAKLGFALQAQAGAVYTWVKKD